MADSVIEILDKKENKLLNRIEIIALIKHPASGTPSKTNIRKVIASKLKVDIDKVYVVKLYSEYGISMSKAHIHVYDSKEKALEIEPIHIIKHNTSSSNNA